MPFLKTKTPLAKKGKSSGKIFKQKIPLQPEKTFALKPSAKVRFLKAAILVFLLGLILNFNYFYSQLKFVLRGRTVSFEFYQAKKSEEIGQPDILQIKSLGLTAPVVYVQNEDEMEFQEALASGVVHYPKTALPGEAGNVYIFGHSSDYLWSKGSYRTVFAALPQAEIGDEVKLSNSEGKVFTYIIVEKFITGPNDLSVLAQPKDRKMLTLQTSWPLGTALKRFIVRAEIK